MTVKTQRFTAVCEKCGPALFNFHSEKTADGDFVWCTSCKNKQTFQEAESNWHQEEYKNSENNFRSNFRKQKRG